MEIPVQPVVLSLPSLVYLGLLKRKGASWRDALGKAGLRGCGWKHYARGVAVLAVLLGLSWAAAQLAPTDALRRPGVAASYYVEWSRGVAAFFLAWLREAVYVGLGEEIFFRGLLGGWLARRLGFRAGNAVQTSVFLLPHLLMLFAGLDLWPLLVAPAAAGWLLGWLRHRSGSILPGWLVHSLANAFAALQVMV